MKRFLIVVALVASAAQGRELSSMYVVPAAANTPGKNGTDWHTDLTLVNPHGFSLPIVLQFLPSGRDNRVGVPTVTFDLLAYESLNLWDVLGPNGFDARGSTGALLVATDTDKIACPTNSAQCDFVVFSRTYTIGPLPGEFGQALPGSPAGWGMDSTVLAYLPQLSNDADFRTNLGVASLADDFVEVGYDVQAPDGQILARESTWIAPFGHAQWGLNTTITGGSVVFYIKSGPQDAMLFPYASVVNQRTGDPVYVEAHMTVVGVSAQGLSARALSKSPALPPRLPAPSFRLPR
ncbi:hypothetical protein EG19_06060 [Thermoanaerobaculum aquaticum]|uniref:Uncharacterized protein n=1 Tax=Thermoanaerobaculum aquaticum TaxID=1312852 RepID=A0A062XYX1_9BACT|nr:hypothetical protein [Thermoanaerobaculum aquaticum]KDA53311.1 hypothetical protein EG19_06060 [Thermoanaerobaculum aquaticum]